MEKIIIITAKGGNLSIPDKHLIEIAGKPLVSYPIEASKSSKFADDVFISTDDQRIKEIGIRYSVKVIDRPKGLAEPDTNHGDVIVHAANFVKENYYVDLEIVTILLGNTVMLDGDTIDESIENLINDPDLDSSMTVWKAQDDHPFRAMVINKKGYLESFLKDINPDTNRQSYPDVYFYDQGPWSLRYSTLMKSLENKEGPGPWWWMGKKCLPIEKPWITGKDLHGKLDLWFSKKWVENRDS